MVENSWSNRGFRVANRADTEEVGNHWVDSGSFLEGPSNGRCVIAAREWGSPRRVLAYMREGSLVKDKGCQF